MFDPYTLKTNGIDGIDMHDMYYQMAWFYWFWKENRNAHEQF